MRPRAGHHVCCRFDKCRGPAPARTCVARAVGPASAPRCPPHHVDRVRIGSCIGLSALRIKRDGLCTQPLSSIEVRTVASRWSEYGGVPSLGAPEPAAVGYVGGAPGACKAGRRDITALLVWRGSGWALDWLHHAVPVL